MFETADQPALVAYRGLFDRFHGLPAAVSRTLLVRFDYNKFDHDPFSVVGTDSEGSLSTRFPSDVVAGPFDLVLVDGPLGYRNRYARRTALGILAHALASQFVVLFDDAERPGEQCTPPIGAAL